MNCCLILFYIFLNLFLFFSKQYIPTTPSPPFAPSRLHHVPKMNFLWVQEIFLFINSPGYCFSGSIFILQSLFKHAFSNPQFLVFLGFEYVAFRTPSCLLKGVSASLWSLGCDVSALHLCHPHFYDHIYVVDLFALYLILGRNNHLNMNPIYIIKTG